MERYVLFSAPILLKSYLYLIIFSIMGVTVVLFAALIIQRLRVERRENLLKKLYDTYTFTLSRALADPTVSVPQPEQSADYEALGDAIIDMMVNVSGSTFKHLQTIARDHGVVDYYRAKVANRSWVKRYRAIEKLGFLSLPELAPLFRDQLSKEEDIHVITKTIWALSIIACSDDLPLINRHLNDQRFASSKFSTYVYTNIIRSFLSRDEESLFLTFLSTLRDDASMTITLKKDIIEACGAEHLQQAEKTIIVYYRWFNDKPEMRISCIRALENLGVADVASIIEEGLKDNDWRVRAVAAKDAHVCPETIIGPLSQVLRDSNYYVRLNAAQSLARMGEKGLAVLKQESSASNDRFVRDITNYVLMDKGYA